MSSTGDAAVDAALSGIPQAPDAAPDAARDPGAEVTALAQAHESLRARLDATVP